MKEKIKQKLERYGYKYFESENKINVTLDFSQSVTIDFSKDGKYLMSDSLNAWNFLTGLMRMSINKTMIYNSIGLFLVAFFLMFIVRTVTFFNFLILFILFSSWTILWTAYYLIKLEFFKKQVIDWIEEKN